MISPDEFTKGREEDEKALQELKEMMAQKTQKEEVQDTTGTDKNGHPYLQPGAEYTFGPDGFPIEAPPKGEIYDEVKNPNTGVVYEYFDHNNGWKSNEATMKERVRVEVIRDGKMDAQGNTDLIKMTPEDRAEIAAGIARAMGK